VTFVEFYWEWHRIEDDPEMGGAAKALLLSQL
jgi:hypothetical protein